jgi:hypothetical protein
MVIVTSAAIIVWAGQQSTASHRQGGKQSETQGFFLRHYWFHVIDPLSSLFSRYTAEK